MPDYTPVSCDLHAHLEAIATQKRQCRITYRERADKLTQVSGQIVDIYAAEDGDWCKLGDGRLIRIERIEAFEQELK